VTNGCIQRPSSPPLSLAEPVPTKAQACIFRATDQEQHDPVDWHAGAAHAARGRTLRLSPGRNQNEVFAAGRLRRTWDRRSMEAQRAHTGLRPSWRRQPDARDSAHPIVHRHPERAGWRHPTALALKCRRYRQPHRRGASGSGVASDRWAGYHRLILRRISVESKVPASIDKSIRCLRTADPICRHRPRHEQRQL